MMPLFFSSCLTLTKKSKLILAKFRERRPSRVCHHEVALFSSCLTLTRKLKSFLQNFANGGHREFAIMTPRVLLDAYKKVEIHLCKILQMVQVNKS